MRPVELDQREYAHGQPDDCKKIREFTVRRYVTLKVDVDFYAKAHECLSLAVGIEWKLVNAMQ
jgi:hypothetical protein